MSKSTHQPPLVVRLHSEYFSSAIWFVASDIDFETASLSPELERDIEAWNDLIYEHNDAVWDGKSPRPSRDAAVLAAREAARIATGITLAKRLATELGAHFTIQFDDAKTERERWHHSPAPASNPAAEAAFLALEAEEEVIRRRARRL